eukprot:3934627-Rhodomonas_salina.1
MQAAYFMGQQHNGGSPKATPGQPNGGGKAPHVNTDPNATCPKCKIHHPGGLHTCPNYQESKQMIKAKYNNRKVQKKNKGQKQPDKSPDQQLPQVDVPAFLAETIEQSEETRLMGAELFGTFSKNPPCIFMAGVESCVKIEELSDGPSDLCTSSSEDESSKEESRIPIAESVVNKKGGLLNGTARVLATVLHLLNTVRIEICNMDSMRQLTFLLLLAFAATFSPSMIVWVAVEAYLGSCNHSRRVSQLHINETYFPSTPDPPVNFKPVYKFKVHDQPTRFKARQYTQVNVCRISSQILVAAGRADDERIHVDSGCAISIFRARELMVNLQEIKPIVAQAFKGACKRDLTSADHGQNSTSASADHKP